MLKKLPMSLRIYILILLINFVFMWAYSCFSQSEMSTMSQEEGSRGEKLFKVNCSGCHLKGQNLIKPNKPVAGSLKLKTKESFKSFIESPPPPMPSFKNITGKSEQLDALYVYVTSLMGK